MLKKVLFIFCLFLVDCKCSSSCSNHLKTNERIDCYPETNGLTKKECEDRGCCYQPALEGDSFDSVPWCFFPSDYLTYNLTTISAYRQGFSGILNLANTYNYPANSLPKLKLNITFETSTIVRIKIEDTTKLRYEVPLPRPTYTPDSASTENTYMVEVGQKRFGISVTRRSNGAVLFNSTIAPLLFGDQFLQMSTTLGSNFVYGLGERHGNFLLDVNWNRFSFWARDQIPTKNGNLYGDHPFYMVMEPAGTAYGVFFRNSNAKDVELQPLPSLTWRSIGGVLDLYVLTGPTPADVVRQYIEIVGHPFMPPLWSLGFHLCRWGYGTSNTTLDYVKKMRNAAIPQDVQWNDIDYMDDKMDFTYDKENFSSLPDVVEDLHKHHQHYVMIIDPGISNSQKPGKYMPYDLGHEYDIFIKNAKDNEEVGIVWPGKTVFPDFSNPKTSKYWWKMLQSYHDQVPFDGVWIDMNEISNFLDGSTEGCTNLPEDNPPYTPRVTGGKLQSRTLCPSSKQHLSTHYNIHSLSGTMEMQATAEALMAIRNKRPFVISRSTFSGAGKHGGHWSGDVVSSWEYLRYSIQSVLSFNMFGIPMVGADICGFGKSTTEELCIRWSQLGAFYPFSRNHNDLAAKPQAPVDFSQETQNIIKQALDIRYSLMPYLYTLFHYANVNGTTVARPLFFEFPNDRNTYSIERQFLWGSALLISPVLEEHVEHIDMYLPAGFWYSFSGSFGTLTVSDGKMIKLPVDLNFIPLHVRGGSILPGVYSETVTSVSYPYWLAVAPDEENKACGTLYYDDGDSLMTYEHGEYVLVDMVLDGNSLFISYSKGDKKLLSSMYLTSIFVFGVNKKPSSATINDQPAFYRMTDHPGVLQITVGSKFMESISVKWSFD